MRPISAYVHFPWCKKKCPYCDFVSFVSPSIDHAGYADAVIRELDARRSALAGRSLTTIFFGGGTPSLWEPGELGRVLDALVRAGAAASDLEVTVECNPTSLDEARARALLDLGVNRLSIGVQGLDSERLTFLGRLHGPEGGLEAVRGALRAAGERPGVRVSADLIYGVATGQRVETARESAAEAACVAALGVTHVSAYSLTIEPGTQFGELARRGKLPIAPDDSVADAFLAVEEALEPLGFAHYEVSNYAKEGDEARHNLAYWHGQDYLGLGCGAFGTLGDEVGNGAVRYRNVPDPVAYVASANGGDVEALVQSAERLDGPTRLRERIMLGLRLAEGFDLGAAAEELGVEPWSEGRRRAVDRLVGSGRLAVDGTRLRIPRSARTFTDGIAAELF